MHYASSVLCAPLHTPSGAPLSVSPRQAVRVTVAYGVHYRPAKLYTPEHEVIKFDDETGVGTVSITDYAQKSLGDVVFVELPDKGATIEQGGESLSFVCLKPACPIL